MIASKYATIASWATPIGSAGRAADEIKRSRGKGIQNCFVQDMTKEDEKEEYAFAGRAPDEDGNIGFMTGVKY
jgi:hypothetical protein